MRSHQTKERTNWPESRKESKGDERNRSQHAQKKRNEAKLTRKLERKELTRKLERKNNEPLRKNKLARMTPIPRQQTNEKRKKNQTNKNQAK
jgi:hypothetical protein